MARNKLLLGAILLSVLFVCGGWLLWQKISTPFLDVPSQLKSETSAFLTTAYRNQAVYDRAFSSALREQKEVSAQALITAHHFLAAPLIARSYAAVANKEVRRILLVSPDHFQTPFAPGQLAYTSDTPWDALFGILSTDQVFIKGITAHKEVINKKQPFLGEHGIYTEVPFLKHFFPEAQIVPLILKNTSNDEDFVALGAALEQAALGTETLVVVSSDFSHHTTHVGAQEQDMASIGVLEHLRQGQFDKLHNDCRSCIAFLSGYLSSKDDQSVFHLLENKDATDFGGKNSDVTSYVTGYFSPTLSVAPSVETVSPTRESVQILFGGDLMFDRSIRIAMRKRGNDFPLAPLREILTGADRVVANLEGPITDNVSLSETSAMGAHDNYFFTFDPSVASLLKEFHIGPVNIGNNHILNFKEEGVLQTKQHLSEAGVDSFGSPLSGDQRLLLQEIKGVTIALVNYNQFVWQGKEKAFADIASAKQSADVVILYTHWGTEYVPATEAVKILAHQFIDGGADLIIGSHPHVVQEREIYQGKTIYYSLGNMVFDQYFSKETEHGLLVRATLDTQTKHFSFEEIPLILKSNGQTSIALEKEP